MNRLTILSILFSFCLSACSVDQSDDRSSDTEPDSANDELYNAVNEPLEKAKEVEDLLKQAAEKRDAELDQ